VSADARIVGSTLRDAAAAIRALGGDAAALFAETGVAPAREAQPLRGFVALLDRAAGALDAPDFGWAMARRFDLANLGPAGEAAERAPTLGAALSLLCGAFAAVQTDTTLSLSVADGEATLTYRILDPDIWPRDQDAALTLGVFLGLVARAAGPGFRPDAVEFEHAPRGPRPLAEAAARCPVGYGGEANRLRFPARLLGQPMPRRDPARFAALAAPVLAAADRAAGAAPLGRRAAREVWRRLGAEPVDQAGVAAALGLGERTFRRRLEAEGAAFSDILADCRLGLARRLLASTALPVAEIADRLGYADATAFERAFRRWAGCTPLEHRRAARDLQPGAACAAGPPRL
jgi:AraC-like DNA-binding protein